MVGYLGLLLLAAIASQLPQRKPTAEAASSVQDHVRVERVILTGRVIDRFASGVLGLSKDDFRIRVDGRPTPIESVDWIPSPSSAHPGLPRITVGGLPATDSEPTGEADTARRPPVARTIVMLFQWEIAGQKDTGFIRMMRLAERMVDALGPNDKVAVLGFGASLRLLQDFTTDHVALRHAIEGIRGVAHDGRPAAASGPSLSAGIARCGPRESIAKAITCIGASLQTLPGQKSLMFFGWTVGRPKEGPWFVEYPAMVEAVGRADTAVYVLDVSDYRHTLQVGLKQLAADTGGLFNGGCIYEMIYCADLATQKTQAAVEGGSYEIVFSDPGLAAGWHEVDVQLTSHAWIPLFRRWYRN